MPRHIICAAIVLSLTWTGAPAQETDTRPEAPDKIEMSAAELFAFADAARDRGELELAEKAYRALARDPELELRVEARFRLGMMLADRMGKYREAAVEFRAILDEKPDAAGVRLQLARMHAPLDSVQPRPHIAHHGTHHHFRARRARTQSQRHRYRSAA